MNSRIRKRKEFYESLTREQRKSQSLKFYKNHLVTKYGAKFTYEQIEEFDKAENKLRNLQKKRKRRAMARLGKGKTYFPEMDAPLLDYGRVEGFSVNFSSQEQFNRKLSNLQWRGSTSFIREKAKQYKTSYNKSIQSTFQGYIDNSEIVELQNAITNMSIEQFEDMINADLIPSIQDLYETKFGYEAQISIIQDKFYKIKRYVMNEKK